MPASAISVPRDSSHLLGDALLQGATLLDSQPCPICVTPLVAKKGETTAWCVKCQAPIMTESQYNATHTVALDAPVAAAESSSAAFSDDFDDEVDYVAPDSAYSSTPDTAISSMGTYLLQGYTMLPTLCKTCSTPLMKNKAGGTVCVSCEVSGNSNDIAVNISKSESGEINVALASQASPSNGVLKVSLKPTGAASSPAMSEDDMHKALSSALLRGSAMLAEVCINPGCHHMPLVRDRKGVVECVGCGPVGEKPAPVATPTTESSDEVVPEEDDEETMRAMREAMEDIAARRARQASGTKSPAEINQAKLSKMLLSGYAMLAESCENEGCNFMPLLRSRGGVIECAGCGIVGEKKKEEVVVKRKQYEDDEDEDEDEDEGGASEAELNYYRSMGMGSLDDLAGSNFDSVYTEAPGAKFINEPVMNFGGSAVDKRLAALLMEGCVMTTKACGVCNGVLMERGVKKEIICATCDDAVLVKAANEQTQEDGDGDAAFEEEARAIQMSARSQVAPFFSPSRSKATVVASKPAVLSSAHGAIASSALTTVMKKIEAAQRDLESCTDVGMCIELAGMIKHMAEAAKALQVLD
jgi:uncharacterized Zn finger protein (UPF0148 family)